MKYQRDYMSMIEDECTTVMLRKVDSTSRGSKEGI